jgi:hypothetical protein
MKTVRQAMMLAIAASLLCAPLALAQTPVSDAEFKCQSKATAASTKFVSAKSKCIIKCFQNHWKGLGPAGDCYPPYAGATLTCITDPILQKGAEEKFVATTRKNCDPTVKVGTECPPCYEPSEDCSDVGYAGNYMQLIEGQIDSFVPGVGCELTGATAEEQKCQTGTAKALVKQTGGVVKCYIKCMANVRKGIGTYADCLPPATDLVTADCINKVVQKAIAGVNKPCSDVHGVNGVDALPDCSSPDDYPDGATWTNLVDIAISGNIPNNFCQNP